MVIAAGGDGTLNEVVNGISDRFDDIAIALLPLGTGNDFARSLGLPFEIQAALDIIAAAKFRHVDVVRVNKGERHFLNVSAGGFSGLVDENLTPESKESWGPLAYLRSAAIAFAQLQAYDAAIAIDDRECLSLNVYNVVVANGRFVAGGLPIAPEASIDDGELDLVLLRETSPARLALLVPKLVNGSHLHDEPSVIYRRAKGVRINSRCGMPFNVDGELIGDGPLSFDVLPRALRFVVP
jgi:diacylglycerol kinase (ATP)